MTNIKRKNISVRVRFNVFKRDGFKCQYCGKSAPEVVLHVDHITPVCEGGDNNLLNLITSCFDCNMGKSGYKLDDNSTLTKQVVQLQEINERREQLEMLSNWRTHLLEFDKQKVDIIVDEFCKRYAAETLGQSCIAEAYQWIKKYSMEEIFAAIDVVVGKKWASPPVAFSMIPKFIHASRMPDNVKDLLYIRGIVRNRLNNRYYSDKSAIIILTEAAKRGVALTSMTEVAKSVTTWSRFVESIKSLEASPLPG